MSEQDLCLEDEPHRWSSRIDRWRYEKRQETVCAYGLQPSDVADPREDRLCNDRRCSTAWSILNGKQSISFLHPSSYRNVLEYPASSVLPAMVRLRQFVSGRVSPPGPRREFLRGIGISDIRSMYLFVYYVKLSLEDERLSRRKVSVTCDVQAG
ncbi:hypothetical protein M422DRAFT_247474 [Sphaerobolus stellatus SS14]|nr:hypothetical protein M422DRAFT_247474 [Sphaerobolus stellatus SS14]